MIQPFLSPGQVTGIGGRAVSMGAEARWVGAGGQGGSLAYKISKLVLGQKNAGGKTKITVLITEFGMCQARG